MISGSDISRVFNPTSDSLGASNGISRGGFASPHSLDSDIEKEELVKSPAMIVHKKIREAKALAALKNHREAEKRRRERITSHLATLRELVPCTAKMDKATLLAKVISRVKELKKNAAEASKGFLIPMDADEVKVEPSYDGSMSYRASVCCDYRPELLSELTQTLEALQLQLALSFVLDKASSSMEYSLTTSNPSKRSRLCYAKYNFILKLKLSLSLLIYIAIASVVF
ncbi:transcription factor bHLH106-like [Gastrolobium bilobum]|uniref:transcription factor bHLH106-like n=1 Tax=Gastrolobium bilobum TaxID=150636 RepID=UPI002AAF37E4|nr:transcription factor bHLH106-like [Gastrolobium bilobum]